MYLSQIAICHEHIQGIGILETASTLLRPDDGDDGNLLQVFGVWTKALLYNKKYVIHRRRSFFNRGFGY